MPEPNPPAARPASSRDSRTPGAGAATDQQRENLRTRLLRITVVSIALITLIVAALVAYLLFSTAGLGSPVTMAVLAAAAAGCLAVLAFGAINAIHAVQERFSRLRNTTRQHHQEIQRFVEALRRGERAYPLAPDPPPLDSDQSQLLAHDLERLRHLAMIALLEAPMIAPQAVPDHRVGVFVNLARRLQSLVHREIQLLDELEAQVEDPDLLKGLFSVDHLATRIRRHAENLAVLGGAVSRRQWSKPVNLYEVLRSAVAEVERYSRVKLVRPIEGTLQGHAVADVIHLVAELVENATNFSNPQTQVLLRAQRVTAGLAVEVEDRGLGMPREEQHRINNMLAAPDQIDIDELLRDGRIGLFVVSALAHRHGIAVQLQTNIYGGVQAVIVLPPGLLGAEPAEQGQARQPPVPEQRQVPAPAASPPTVHPPAVGPPAVGQTSPAPEALPVRVGAASSYPAGRGADELSLAGQPVPMMTRRPMDSPPPRDGHYPSVGNGHSGSAPEPEFARPSPPLETTQSMPTITPHRPANPPDPGEPSTAGSDPRPPLPHRRRQTHLTPQLREAPAVDADDPADGPDPGLMSAFQRGFGRRDAPGEEPGTQPGHSAKN